MIYFGVLFAVFGGLSVFFFVWSGYSEGALGFFCRQKLFMLMVLLG
jgi:hypothetical protein